MKARRFFRIWADSCYGYLTRKKKQQTPREEEVEKARHVYNSGIKDAWNIYTENNQLVKKANTTLDGTIHQAYEVIFKNEENMSKKEDTRARHLYVKATRKAYEDFAEAVNHIWEDFTKDMERL